MAYTEVRNINGRNYFYRVVSIRRGPKVSKKRVYLGVDLDKGKLLVKEKNADGKLLPKEMKNKNKKIGEIKSKIVNILKQNKVIKAGIFGSYSRGKQKENSDIDILIQIDPDYDKKLSLLDIIRLQYLLEKKLRKKIDLVEYSALHHLLREKILKEEIRII